MEDACSETPGCRHGVVWWGDISMTRDRGPPLVQAEFLHMKNLKEDKNDSVVNATLKPEEKKTLRGENHVLRHDKMKYVFEKRRWFMGEYCC